MTRKSRILKFSALGLLTACVITAGAARLRIVRGASAETGIVTPPAASERGLDPVSASERAGRQPAFTITLTRTTSTPDGQSRLLQTSKRYQRADGAYKIVHTFPGRGGAADRVEIVLGLAGLGAFRLDEEQRRLIFISPMVEEQPEDVETYLRDDPRFNREENVQGQHSIVWRTSTPRDAGFIEEYRAPALGGLLIKRVEESARGRQALETTEIEMAEPAASLFHDLYQYPADYTRYEQSIEQAERAQQRDTARVMRELLRRMKTFKLDRR
ncbi:MAG: hypothetical protein LC803_09070 [Acidobacteria bacterium]|nr:hypothetical protein [Acidobacteriota bacterium]